MIRCIKCLDGVFSEGGNKLTCAKCGFKIPMQDGLVIFHPVDSAIHGGMESCILDDVISFEDKHFWMKSRRDFIKSIFNKYVNYANKIIEIGAGTGSITRCLLENGYNDISVGEVHLSGLEYARSYGIKQRYQFDLMKTPFYEHFDVVGMFDVLEHIDDDDLAVKNIYKMLKPGGKAIVTVPAHKWLWSKQDAIAYHRRRYEAEQLKKLFEENGFNILETRAFFISILPLLYLRTFVDRDNGVLKENDFKERFRVNPVINFILGQILPIENRLLANASPIWGGSLLIVAERLR